MDSFELIIGELLEAGNFWVRKQIKLPISKKEKQNLGIPTMPTPTIDMAIYSPKEETIYLLEIKSFLDSAGVVLDHITEYTEENQIDYNISKSAYKILTSVTYQKMLQKSFKKNYKSLYKNTVKIKFGLVAGNIKGGQGSEDALEKYFKEKGWFFWGPTEIKKVLDEVVKESYTNTILSMTTKLLLRT